MGEAPWSIRLLGQFELHGGDRAVVTLGSRRAESLLALVLVHRDRRMSRQQVAHHLWPDSTEAQAMTNLRHLLHNLRRSWPDIDAHLDAGAQDVHWRRDPPYVLDVARFEDALAIEAWADAVEAYGGDLLAGRDEEWLQEERARLRRCYLDALEQVAAAEESHGDPRRALPYAERLLREDPLREATYRLMIQLYDASGDRALAVRAYHECAATLEHELGVEPAAATRAAYDAVLAPEPRSGPTPSRLGGPPFVGRIPERAALAAAWREARDGRSGLVLVTGEPGIGKTRLAEELRTWCSHRGAVTAMARAYAAEGAPAYAPVIGWLRTDDLARRIPGLAPPHLNELARLLPELLALPGLVPPERLPEAEQRQRLHDAVTRALVQPGAPALLVADDAQWWDREALQLLHHIVRSDPTAPLLVVATARTEDVEGNPALRDVLLSLRAAGVLTTIDLPRLGSNETALLAERLGGTRLPEDDAATLHQQTEGNPLFVVEAMHAGWRADDRLLTPKVQAVIESRFAQLSEAARDLVDVAATIGREFTVDLLAASADADEDTVVRLLDELWRRRIVREGEAKAYDFSHDKIREAAYHSLSPPRRRHLHRRVAGALQTVHADDLDPEAGRLAVHHEEAGDTAEAIAAYARAADAAQRVYAHREAARLLMRALDQLAVLPETPERSARELELLTALLAPLVATEGYTSLAIRSAQERALELVAGLDAAPAPPLLRSLGLGSLARGDFAAARTFGLALRGCGERDDDDLLRVEGDYLLGVAAFWAGELVDARRHLECAVATYREENRPEHLLRYAQDPKAICLTRLALTHWFLGDRAAAVRARDDGLAFAEEIGHPYSLATGLLFAALLALDMQDPPAVRDYVARARAAPVGDAGVQIAGALEAFDVYLGVLAGDAPEGVARIQRIVADTRPDDQAAPGLHSALLRILLAASEAVGDVDTGLAAADELAGLTTSMVWRPEAARAKARLLSRNSPGNG